MRKQISRFLSTGLLVLLAGCGGGGGGSAGTSDSSSDTTPSTFSFAERSGAGLSTGVTSNPITVAGINASTPISITGGEYSIDDGPFSSAPGTVTNGQTIRVRVTTSSQFSTPSVVVLTIGGVSASFTAITQPPDLTPDSFQFAKRFNQTRGAWVTSDVVTVSGVDTDAPVSIENGEYALGGGAFTSAPASVAPGQSLTIRVRASATYAKAVRARVTVGTYSTDFEITSEAPAYVPDGVAYDGQDLIYLLSSAHKLIFKWSIAEARYLDSYVIGDSTGPAPKIAYSNDHQRLYLGYSTGAIRYIDTTAAQSAEVPFATLPRSVDGLVAVGTHLMAQDATAPWETHYVINRNGVITDRQDWNHYSREYAWDPVTSRVYFFRDTTSPNDLHYEVIDQATGVITSAGETPYHGSYSIAPPIRVSQDGQHVLLGSGDIYKGAGLIWSGALGSQVADARWFANGSLVTLASANNQTTLRRVGGTNLATQEQLTYAGQSLRVLGSDARMVVLVVNNGTVQFHNYVPNNDSDSDGVTNTQDAFPLDPAASLDTDHDGYPDAWNAGLSQSDSTTGLSLDPFPQDSACYLPSHGSGGVCNYAATVPNYVPDQVVSHGDIVYLLSSANRRVYRWSIATGQYLNPYVVGLGQGFTTLAPTKIAYSSIQQRLYLGYSTGAIQYIDVTSGAGEVPFANTAMAVNGLAAVGNYLLAQDGSGAWGTHYIINRSGVITDQNDWNYYSREYAWDPVTSRVYFFRDSMSPNDLHYEVIDQATGIITSTGETPYHGSYNIVPPIRVSANGQYVLLGSGDIYNQTGLTWAGSVGSQVTDARWFADGSLVTLNTVGNQTLLRRLGANLATLEQLTYTGPALRVVGSDTRMALVLINNSTVQFQIYVPNNDSDGDGAPNTQDAFPLDRAASVDTDGDGYPNSWNVGRTQSDSTTGLSLDAFPQDSACYLGTHGSGGVCNYSATIPNYVPDQVLNNGDIVYLLSSANKRVYRWSIATGQYLNPYVVGINQGFSTLAPTRMAYSSSHQRLYLAYSTGAIRYIDVSGSSTAEIAFSNTAMAASNILAAGNYLLAEDGSGAWGTHYVFNNSGVLTDSEDWNYHSQEYAWDPVTSRAYFFRDGSPTDLHFEVVDQATGQITSEGETPYHGSYLIASPIRVSANGQYILLGSGDIYNQSGLTWARSLGSQITDGRWFANGSLVTLSTASNQTTLRRRGANLAILEQLTYTGSALRVVGSDTRMAVLVIQNSTVQFHVYQPNDDTDGDGVDNTQDAFPTDPAASVDTDHDGRPDAWNPGKSQSDSTTGLTLDAYPQDSGCYLGAHGSGGVCNPTATVPNYLPDQVISDGDIIYLLSVANKRVYRWSIADEEYLNPYVVGIDEGFGTIAPTKMAYSSAHQRLYLGYSTGAIRYVDVTANNGPEVPFANTAMAVHGLASVGNFVMAQDNSGAWESHYVINSSGVITDLEEWNYYSREYAWDPVTSRVYFFRDNQSPGDLHYEVVDQTTGTITSEGETPYHGAYGHSPPIRVSDNGQYVLLGTGDIYNQAGLTWAGSLGTVIADARWFADGSVVTLSTGSNQTTLRRRGATNLANLEQLNYSGTALRIVGGDTKMAVLVANGGTVQFHIYEPNDDSDGDGVINTQDAFPLDPAASADSDHDGYPNAWNAGRTQSDSTTGLSLDAFPQDSACYLSSHGSGGVCNYGATIPNYVPDQVISEGDTVYLLSRANGRVYRWSIATGQYLNPYVVGLDQGFSTIAPTLIAYSSAHQRLYLGYSTGAIHYIEIGAASQAEVPFSNTAMAVNGLASVGNYVLAQDGSGAWATHYIFNSSGTVTDSADWNHYSSEYAWDPVTSRVYFFRDGTSPNDLLYEVIDQATGQISSTGETPYHGSYNYQRPIRVSANGQRILLGTGDIYDQTLNFAATLGKTIRDGHWTGNLLVDLDTSGLVEIRNATSRAVLSSVQHTGQPIRMVFGHTEAYLVHVVNNTTAFTKLPFGDQDADQIPQWWEELYGLSDSNPADALGDLDGDGVNNRNEYLNNTSPVGG